MLTCLPMTKVNDSAGGLPNCVCAEDTLLSKIQACYIEALKQQLRDAFPICLHHAEVLFDDPC